MTNKQTSSISAQSVLTDTSPICKLPN